MNRDGKKPLNKRIAIRVDANQHIGLGHFFRCLNLAKILRQSCGVESIFFVLESSLIEIVRAQLSSGGFECLTCSEKNDPWRDSPSRFIADCQRLGVVGALLDLLAPGNEDIDLLQDIPWQPSPIDDFVGRLETLGLPVFLYSDSLQPMTRFGRLTINPSPSQNLSHYAAKRHKALLLGPEFHVSDPALKVSNAKKNLGKHMLAFFGGYDHIGFGSALIDYWKKLSDRPPLRIVIGGGTPNPKHTVDFFRNHGVDVGLNIQNMASEYSKAKMTVTAGGTSLYDLAALGVPAAAAATRQRQADSIVYLETQGACINLGLGLDEFTQALPHLFSVFTEESRLQSLARTGPKIIDGKGGQRIATAITHALTQEENRP